MGPAKVLLMEHAAHGVALDRYTATGEFGGDTWHQDVAEARAQADFEFSGRVVTWHDIPNEIEDPLPYALDAAAREP